MIATKRIIASTLVVVVILAGLVAACNQMPERLNGAYEGYQSVPVAPGTDPIVARQLGLVRLTAQEDGTAILSNQGIPIQGHIDYGSQSATFVPDRFLSIATGQNSQDLEQYKVQLTPQKNGDWLYAGKIELSSMKTK